jgi:phosphoglycolate phosphatase
MIGDRKHDVRAAKENGVRSLGVLWGYGSRQELIGAGADALCETPAELFECVAEVAATPV